MDKNEFFNKVCSQYYEKILKYCYISLNNEENAKDITQEVFILLFKKADKLYKHPNIGGFLFKSAQNLIKEHKRELYRRLIKEIDSKNGIEFLADNKNDIFAVMDKRINEYDYIDEVIDKLSEDKKSLYKMYYIDKISMAQIADMLGIKPSALRMRFTRLRREIIKNVKKLAKEKF